MTTTTNENPVTVSALAIEQAIAAAVQTQVEKTVEHAVEQNFEEHMTTEERAEQVKANQERAERLEEIQQEMLDLLNEARDLVSGTAEEDRAHHYWYAHVKTALTDDHDYLGGSMFTMHDAIRALRGESEEE